jgi:hypothetical protein
LDRVRGVEGATLAMGKEVMMMERRWRRWGGDGGGKGGGPVATRRCMVTEVAVRMAAVRVEQREPQRGR